MSWRNDFRVKSLKAVLARKIFVENILSIFDLLIEQSNSSAYYCQLFIRNCPMYLKGQRNPPLKNNKHYLSHSTPIPEKKRKDRENSNNKMPKHTVTSYGDSA